MIFPSQIFRGNLVPSQTFLLSIYTGMTYPAFLQKKNLW